MTSSKHPQGPADRKAGLGADTPRPPDDLERNPGIGASKGTQSRSTRGPGEIAGESTSEGDVMNDTKPQGGVDHEVCSVVREEVVPRPASRVPRHRRAGGTGASG